MVYWMLKPMGIQSEGIFRLVKKQKALSIPKIINFTSRKRIKKMEEVYNTLGIIGVKYFGFFFSKFHPFIFLIALFLWKTKISEIFMSGHSKRCGIRCAPKADAFFYISLSLKFVRGLGYYNSVNFFEKCP